MSGSIPNQPKDWFKESNKLCFGGLNREAWLCPLDNFYRFPMEIEVPYAPEPIEFSTIEHYFQSAKFIGFNNEWADRVRQAASGKEAQLLGREMRLPPEVLQRWKEGGSTRAMRRALKAKFVDASDGEPAKALLKTGDRTLVEVVEECVIAAFVQSQLSMLIIISTSNSDPAWDDKLVRELVYRSSGENAKLIVYMTSRQWGAGKDGKGVNRMGILLMEARKELQQ